MSKATTEEEKVQSKAMPTRASGDRVTRVRINPVDGLEHFLRAVEGQRRQGRLKCDRGRLRLVSPGFRHERAGFRLGIMLNEVFCGLRILTIAGSSTLYRQKREGHFDRGIEPDLSYYIQNAARVRGLSEIDLRVCPPPDLVIEVVDSHSAKTAVGVCLELRVPEVWVYDARSGQLTIRSLHQKGPETFQYVIVETSIVLPFLRSAAIVPWCAVTDEGDMDFTLRARAWVETELLPRYRAGGAGE
jgi:Uma2 family endonuclease